MLMRGVKRAEMWDGDEQMLSNSQAPFTIGTTTGGREEARREEGFLLLQCAAGSCPGLRKLCFIEEPTNYTTKTSCIMFYSR